MTIDEYINATRVPLDNIGDSDLINFSYLFSIISDRVVNTDVVLHLCATANMESCLVSLDREYLVCDTVSVFFIKELFTIVSSESWFMLEHYYNFIRMISSFQHGDILNNYRYSELIKSEPMYISNTYMDIMKTDVFAHQMAFIIQFIFLHEMAHKYMNSGRRSGVIEILVDNAVQHLYSTETRLGVWKHYKTSINDTLIHEMYCDCEAVLCLLEQSDILPHEHIINSCLSSVALSWAVNRANVQFYNDNAGLVYNQATSVFTRVGVMNWILDTISSDEEFSMLIASHRLNQYEPLKENNKDFTKKLHLFIHKWNALFAADIFDMPLIFGDEIDAVKTHWESQIQNQLTMKYNIFE